MDKPEFFVTPGYGERLLNELHYSQAVKIGNRVEISGQGGWDNDLQIPESLEDEIAQAFRNVERTLATAGAGWEHVVHVNSYHVGTAILIWYFRTTLWGLKTLNSTLSKRKNKCFSPCN